MIAPAETTTTDTKQTLPLHDWPNDAGFDATHEVRGTPVEIPVKGKIPAYAAGTLYRTGPGTNMVTTDKGKVWSASHWFDGFTVVHRFSLLPSTADPSSVGKVTYNSRRMCDGVVDSIRKTGKLDEITFGQKKDPCESIFKKVTNTFSLLMNNGVSEGDRGGAEHPEAANIGVTIQLNHPGYEKVGEKNDTKKHGFRLYTATDATPAQRFDPETLAPLGIANQAMLHPDLKGPLSAAHPEHCPVTGDLFNYNLELGRSPVYRIFAARKATGKTDILATITDARASYIHSFFMTENYVIFCVWNSFFAAGGAKILWEKNIVDALADWDPNTKSKWYVIDRKGDKGVVAVYEGDAFFCFHSINSFEENGDIICDLSAYDNMDIIKKAYYENIKSTAPGAKAFEGDKGDGARTRLMRVRLKDVLSSEVDGSSNGKKAKRPVAIDWSTDKKTSVELPTYNSNYTTKPYRYMYGVTDFGDSSFFDGIGKYDANTKEFKRWCQKGQTPGEPIFVANPQGKDEDDGVLLSVVLDGRTGKSSLLCLDAKTLEEVGKAECDWAVGFGFHGLHVKSTL